MPLTCLPRRVSQCLRGLAPCFHHRHHLVFSWLLVLHLVYGDRANVKALSRHGPVHLAYQPYRRLLCASYWGTKALRWWFADHALQALPPPTEGLLFLVSDSPLKGQRGPNHPVAQKTRLSHLHPYVFGFRIVLLMAQWGVYRLPVDCALLRRKDEAAYQTENALCRQMRREFQPPAWCQELSVVADAAYASRPNMHLIRELGYWSVFALPRTWNFPNGKALKALVTHLPRWGSTRLCIPTLNGQRRRTFWGSAKRVRRRHLGDVTVVLSKGRRNDGPKRTKILVTTLPETVPARQMVALYRRRWWVERLVKELKGVVGLGQHQVTKQVERVERSVAIALMAYLLLLRLQAQHIPADQPWSAFQLQRQCTWEVIHAQCERSARQRLRKWLQMGNAASYHPATCHF
jgi:hypothetical protein